MGQASQMIEQLKQELQTTQTSNVVSIKELELKSKELEVKAYDAETKRMSVEQADPMAQAMAQQQFPPPQAAAPVECDSGEDKLVAILQALSAIQSAQPAPITNVIVEKGGGVRKEITLQAPSGAVYTGTINEQPSEELV